MINEQVGRISAWNSPAGTAFAAHKPGLPCWAGEMTSAVSASELPRLRRGDASPVYQLRRDLDSFQPVLGISLELLEKAAFPFASRCRVEYRWPAFSLQAC